MKKLFCIPLTIIFVLISMECYCASSLSKIKLTKTFVKDGNYSINLINPRFEQLKTQLDNKYEPIVVNSAISYIKELDVALVSSFSNNKDYEESMKKKNEWYAISPEQSAKSHSAESVFTYKQLADKVVIIKQNINKIKNGAKSELVLIISKNNEIYVIVSDKHCFEYKDYTITFIGPLKKFDFRFVENFLNSFELK